VAEFARAVAECGERGILYRILDILDGWDCGVFPITRATGPDKFGNKIILRGRATERHFRRRKLSNARKLYPGRCLIRDSGVGFFVRDENVRGEVP
jgi:hypothetical protein